MAKETIAKLKSLVERLQKERQAHVNAVAEIDAGLEAMGIETQSAGGRPVKRAGKRKPGRPKSKKASKSTRAKKTKKSKKSKRRKRGQFAKSGLDSVVSFVKQQGKNGATGAQITKHWKTEGRAGNPYNTLGLLVRHRKLKRQNIKGERGSRYTAA